MDRTEVWVTLDLIHGIGHTRVCKLLEIFESPETLLSAPTAKVRETGILTPAQVQSLARGPDTRAVKEAVEALKAHGARAVGITDPGYPEALKNIDDPPFVLYVKGSLQDIEPAVAIVGTRSPSHYGRETAWLMARDLSDMGFTVVSGLARGIDSAAHAGALEGSTNTVAVLGTGIDVAYPPENVGLAARIAQRGAIVTEYPPGTPPDPGNFPRRNRIISGLSAGVVVVEAALKSGALITARLAGEQGKLLMAVPGTVTNARSQGPHHLIRQGAVLVRGADDVVMEIAPQVKRMVQDVERDGQTRDEILELVAGDPLSIDDIARELDLDIIETTKRISLLELTGKIRRIEGGRFTARSTNG
ncbi:MAG TPA: DNA-processing protein DprA [Deltaproteobacteria bacterium]|jgi:DNA processing protein|nr:DNA-processing protein DprA [Deltaproteobacteria bacterium]HOI07316.1 DNA-processing protein DprA [Deltaproteobacteria bacterium]